MLRLFPIGGVLGAIALYASALNRQAFEPRIQRLGTVAVFILAR